ncbi:hypothetical protein HS088_TW19G00472 [Tripterygium wilfordii]|uniref:Neprosin PEP catalytic domain-containing protein n=1 Tax=Tripterygium wilfordii TaxID=458696 RepID=A0A7J7C9U3_TRIWF|nr:hypothetical protein HS088_TW19G00472 [Tripterygium wilfordii]
MKRDPLQLTKPVCTHHRTRQELYTQTSLVAGKQTIIQKQQQQHSSKMAASTDHYTSPMMPVFVAFLFVVASSSISPVVLSLPTSSDSGDRVPVNQTFRPGKELQRIKRVHALLKKINKPAVKTIQSPDGDVIDCVLSHQQPAFDHPELRGQKPLDPPERPKGLNYTTEETEAELFQQWRDSGQSCPEGTIPIRRTTEKDILRASSIKKFGRKLRRHVRRDSSGTGHEVSISNGAQILLICSLPKSLKRIGFIAYSEMNLQHAVVFVNGDQYYGAKANINVWAPRVTNAYEFSLSQVWLISGSFGNDLNTIEAGWQASESRVVWRQLPQIFHLLDSFVQTNNKIAIGAAISPRSIYNGRQFDIGLMVWKDPKHGHWWLQFGSGLLVGYWPEFLFSHMRSHASMVQFGGEIVNSRSSGYHTSTQMGSGHFAEEGFGKASYFRNLQVVDWDNNLLPLTNLHLLADHSNCYDVRQGRNTVWGTYFYYGGPGRNVRCP